eukprot:3899947-Prymnesium_polylepis.1
MHCFSIGSQGAMQDFDVVKQRARGPTVSVARPRRVPRPRARSRRPVTHTHLSLRPRSHGQ